MFNSLGWPELAVLLVVGLFVFGPDRLPGLAAQTGRALRSFRSYARGLRDDLADDLGPEIREVNLRSLQNPRAFLVKHVLNDQASPTPRPVRPGHVPRQATAARTDVRRAAAVRVQQEGGPTGPGPTPSEGEIHG